MRLPADRYRPRLRAIDEKGKGYLLLPPRISYSDFRRINVTITFESPETPGIQTFSRCVFCLPRHPWCFTGEPGLTVHLGQPETHCGQLGSRWWRRFCDYPSWGTGQAPWAHPIVPRPHCCRFGHRLVRNSNVQRPRRNQLKPCRNPFNDDLIASGSDDGKV
jgi:hypothetical protein